MFIIFWDFLIDEQKKKKKKKNEQTFISQQVKWSVIISNKLVYTICLTSCQTT